MMQVNAIPRCYFVVATGLSVLFMSSAAYAGVVTPKRASAKILQEAKKSAPVIGTIKKGEELDAGERKGMYWSVQYKGQQGYVSVLQVSTKSGSQGSILSNAIRGVAQESRGTDDVQTSRSRSAVMGVRGLDESDSMGSAGDAQPRLNMVYAMEDREITSKSIEDFGDLVFQEVEQRVAQSER